MTWLKIRDGRIVEGWEQLESGGAAAATASARLKFDLTPFGGGNLRARQEHRFRLPLFRNEPEACQRLPKAGGMAYFPRMLSKIRLHAVSELPPDYHANLGKGADGFCASYLRVQYDVLTQRVSLAGRTTKSWNGVSPTAAG